MPKKLEKIEKNGRLSNKCPICGQACTTSSWNKYKKCIECYRLLRKGIDVNQVKIMRAGESLDKMYVEPEKEIIEDVVDRSILFDFKNSFPPGMRIAVRDKTESKYLQEVYGFYSGKYGVGIPEFTVLIGGILQLDLERYRNSQALMDEDTPPGQRASIQETSIKLINQIERTTRALDEMKKEMSSESGNILQKAFGEMLRYHHENDRVYMGIGVCEDCKKRIIFKTNFATFRIEYEEKIELIANELRQNKKLDSLTIDYFFDIIKKRLDDDSVASTYIIEHTRQLEAELV